MLHHFILKLHLVSIWEDWPIHDEVLRVEFFPVFAWCMTWVAQPSEVSPLIFFVNDIVSKRKIAVGTNTPCTNTDAGF